MSNYIKQGNIKVGAGTGTISKLAGNKCITVKLAELAGMEVSGTCGAFCSGCQGNGIEDIMHAPCYVFKSYRYPSVILSHARTTLAMREDLQQTFNDMDAQLSRKKKPFRYVRINQSGELESAAEFKAWCDLAAKHPETTFWLYTKAFDYVRPHIADIPDNLFLNISIWAEYGIDEYLEYSSISDQVSAFCYCDEDYTPDWYAAHGIQIQAFCQAYDRNGKLNHNITCDKCKLCHCTDLKVTGCWSH